MAQLHGQMGHGKQEKERISWGKCRAFYRRQESRRGLESCVCWVEPVYSLEVCESIATLLNEVVGPRESRLPSPASTSSRWGLVTRGSPVHAMAHRLFNELVGPRSQPVLWRDVPKPHGEAVGFG